MNSDIVFVDVYVKGVRGDVNWEDVFWLMVLNVEEVLLLNNDLWDLSGFMKEGWGVIKDWLKYGYFIMGLIWFVSCVVE